MSLSDLLDHYNSRISYQVAKITSDRADVLVAQILKCLCIEVARCFGRVKLDRAIKIYSIIRKINMQNEVMTLADDGKIKRGYVWAQRWQIRKRIDAKLRLVLVDLVLIQVSLGLGPFDARHRLNLRLNIMVECPSPAHEALVIEQPRTIFFLGDYCKLRHENFCANCVRF